jgi:large subunit ribosomal protein L15
MPQELPVDLSNLQSVPGARKERIRRGRGTGSGLGKTAGRGGKGQTARSGKGRPRGFEGGQSALVRRLPKFGFKSPFKRYYDVINVLQLENRYQAGETVEPESLYEKGLVASKNCFVKILGEGTLSKKLTVRAHRFSKSAIQKINSAGGKIEQIEVVAGTEGEETKGGGG